MKVFKILYVSRSGFWTESRSLYESGDDFKRAHEYDGDVVLGAQYEVPYIPDPSPEFLEKKRLKKIEREEFEKTKGPLDAIKK